MKKILIRSFTISMVSVGSLVTLTNTHAIAKIESSASVKVAVVDVQKAILETNQSKADRENIEKEMSPLRQDILKQQEDIKKLQDQFQQQQAILSDVDKSAKQKEFQIKVQALQAAQTSFDAKARQSEGVAIQQIFSNMQGISADIAKKQGYELVMDKGAGVLLYASNVTDITKFVVDAYNAKYKVGMKK